MSATTHSPSATAARPEAGRRYTATAQALHWITAALMFAVLALAWVMVNMPREAASRELVYTLHKSVGLTILALAAIRLAWRAAHHAPKLRGGHAAWEKAAAFGSHWLLYALLLAMPASGYLLSAAGGHPTSYFGLFTIPAIAKDETLSHAAAWTHVALGQWVLYALILLHVAATVWHVAIRRDDVLERMLPPQREV